MTGVVRHSALVAQEIADTLNFRPNEEDKELLRRLMAKFGLGYTHTIRLAIRRLAEAEGIRDDGPKEGSSAAD